MLSADSTRLSRPCFRAVFVRYCLPAHCQQGVPVVTSTITSRECPISQRNRSNSAHTKRRISTWRRRRQRLFLFVSRGEIAFRLFLFCSHAAVLSTPSSSPLFPTLGRPPEGPARAREGRDAPQHLQQQGALQGKIGVFFFSLEREREPPDRESSDFFFRVPQAFSLDPLAHSPLLLFSLLHTLS